MGRREEEHGLQKNGFHILKKVSVQVSAVFGAGQNDPFFLAYILRMHQCGNV